MGLDVHLGSCLGLSLEIFVSASMSESVVRVKVHIPLLQKIKTCVRVRVRVRVLPLPRHPSFILHSELSMANQASFSCISNGTDNIPAYLPSISIYLGSLAAA